MLQLDEIYYSQETLLVLAEMMLAKSAKKPPEYWSDVSKGSSHAESMVTRLKMGMFTIEDFHTFYFNRYSSGIKAHILPWVISRCLQNHLLLEQGFPDVRMPAVYWVFPPMADLVFELHDKQPSCFEELVYGWNQILKKVRRCIVKISVSNTKKEPLSATGFVCWKSNGEKMIITARHVIQENTIKEIKLENGTILKFKKILPHDKYDLALIEIEHELEDALRFDHSISGILDEVITAGYPNASLLVSQILLFHKGEINGYYTQENGEQIIAISAKGESGSSGGPVINRLGMVTGMVTRESAPTSGTDSMGTLFYWALSSESIRNGMSDLIKN